MKSRRGLLGATALAAMPSLVAAHHSINAFFDRDSIVELQGTITDVRWRNPHAGFVLAVDNAAGERSEWVLETAAVNTLERIGIDRSTIAVGDVVTVTGWPNRRGPDGLYVTEFRLATNGTFVTTSLDARFSRPTIAAAQASAPPGVFKVWTPGALYSIRAPLALTAAAEQARAGWDPVTDDPALRCIAPGMPNAILNPYPIEFIDRGTTMELRMEEWAGQRTIHMTNASPDDSIVPNPMGHSTGRWDGGTLIVTTTHVDWPYLDDRGVPMSGDVEMVERFALSEDDTRLDYELVVTDPVNLAEPAIWDAHWVWDPGTSLKPFECTID